MIMPILRKSCRRIVVDIDTQKHFFEPASAVCVNDHRQVLANVLRVVNWAQTHHVPRVSTMQRLDEKQFAPADIGGETGQLKVDHTVRGRWLNFAPSDRTDLQPDILNRYQQVIFQKRCFNPFDEPKVDRMLSELSVDEFVLVGTATEGAVKATAIGLLSRGRKVTILTDAVGSYNKTIGELALRVLKERGAILTETRAYLNSVYYEPLGWYDWDWR